MEKIYKILEETRPEYDFRKSDDYIEDGFLDSYDVISIVTDLEEKFDILIDPLDIVPENFANADSITKLVKKNGGEV